MSISVTRSQHSQHFKRTLISFFLLTLFLILFNQVYALFAHGVSSLSMSLAFLYPLLGGLLLFGLVSWLRPLIWQQGLYRLAFNLYNSGLATLIASSVITGIFEIAGTNSAYLSHLRWAGLLLVGLGLLLIAFSLFRKSRAN